MSKCKLIEHGGFYSCSVCLGVCRQPPKGDCPGRPRKTLKKLSQLVKEHAEWLAAGCPNRTDEETAAIFKICQACEPYFVATDDTQGNCKLCGCRLSADGKLLNKIRMATTECPLGKWPDPPTPPPPLNTEN